MKIKLYTKIVKGKAGENREGELITRTAWYPDTDETMMKSNLGRPEGRFVEQLKKLEGPQYDNPDGITYYMPQIFLEIKTQANDEERPRHVFTALTTDTRDRGAAEAFRRYKDALPEFVAFRGYMNAFNQRGAVKSKYIHEIGEDK